MHLTHSYFRIYGYSCDCRCQRLKFLLVFLPLFLLNFYFPKYFSDRSCIYSSFSLSWSQDFMVVRHGVSERLCNLMSRYQSFSELASLGYELYKCFVASSTIEWEQKTTTDWNWRMPFSQVESGPSKVFSDEQ